MTVSRPLIGRTDVITSGMQAIAELALNVFSDGLFVFSLQCKKYGSRGSLCTFDAFGMVVRYLGGAFGEVKRLIN